MHQRFDKKARKYQDFHNSHLEMEANGHEKIKSCYLLFTQSSRIRQQGNKKRSMNNSWELFRIIAIHQCSCIGSPTNISANQHPDLL